MDALGYKPARALLLPIFLCGLLGSAAAQTPTPAPAEPLSVAAPPAPPASTGEPAIAAPTPAAESLLFLGVRDVQGQRNDQLSAAVDSRLAGRVRLAATARPSAVAPKLNEVEQLLAIGQLAGASLVLVVDAKPTPSHGYDFMIQLFQVQTLQAFTEQTSCSNCDTPTQPPTQLITTIDLLLGKHPGIMLPLPAAIPVPEPVAPAKRSKLAAGLLGGVAVAALSTAVAFTVLTFNPGSRQYTGNICLDASGNPASCFNNYLPGYATAYAVAGLATVGLVLTLTLPRPGKKAVPPPTVAFR